MNRPEPPTKFDLTPESYYEHNRYFNEAEKLLDHLEERIENVPSLSPKETFHQHYAFPFKIRTWLKSLDKHRKRIP